MGKTFSTGLLTNGIWQDASNNIGIGGSPSGSFKFEVTGTARVSGLLTVANATFGSTGTGNNIIALSNNDQSNTRLRIINTGSGGQTFSIVGGNPGVSNAGLAIFDETNSATRLYVSSAGNVGIGTSSPTNVLHIQGTGTTYFHIGNSSTGSGSSDGADIGYFTGQTSLNIVQRENDAMIFSTNDTERMRITSGGNLCINTTSKIDDGLISISADANLNQGITIRNTNASNNIYYIFFKNSSNAAAGRIEQTGATSVAYASGSDYRLKEDLKDFDGLNKVLSIKTYDFKWKNEDRRDYGVLAHELQEVVSGAVLGQKDELEEDGTIKTQMVDYSKIVPVLIKAIQELNAKVSALENKS
jgi:hypothetical protein